MTYLIKLCEFHIWGSQQIRLLFGFYVYSSEKNLTNSDSGHPAQHALNVIRVNHLTTSIGFFNIIYEYIFVANSSGN